MDELASRWPDSDELFAACMQGLADPAWWVRSWATEMAARWIERRAARAGLLAVALHDDEPWVRYKALDFVAFCWSWQGAVRAATESALCASHAGSRELALLGAAARWYPRGNVAANPATTGDGPAETLLLHRWQASDPAAHPRTDDADHAVRITAVEMLATRQPDEPNTRQLVLNATADMCPGVRQAALRVLGARWPEHPVTRSTLTAALEDSDPAVRSFVLDHVILMTEPEDRATSPTLSKILSDISQEMVNRAFVAVVTMSSRVPAAAVAAARSLDDQGIYHGPRTWLAWRAEERTLDGGPDPVS
jgi:HEAT repeat protein